MYRGTILGQWLKSESGVQVETELKLCVLCKGLQPHNSHNRHAGKHAA